MPERAIRVLSSPRGLAIAAAVIGLLLGGWLWFRPYVNRAHQPITAVPTPLPLDTITPIVLRGHQQLCEGDVAFQPGAREVQFNVLPFPGSGPPLRVTVSGPEGVVTGTLPGGYSGRSRLAVPVASPAHSELATLCLLNAGRTAIPLDATSERRTLSRSRAVLNGRPIPAELSMTLADDRRRSLHQRAGQLADRMAAFKGGFVRPWTVRVVGVALVAVPLALLWALASTLPGDGREGTGPQRSRRRPRMLSRKAEKKI